MNKIYLKDHIDFVKEHICYHYWEMFIVNEAYEYGGRYNKLHLHLIVRAHRTLRFKGFTSIQGFKVRYDRLYTQADIHNAQDYITKDKYDTFKFSN